MIGKQNDENCDLFSATQFQTQYLCSSVVLFGDGLVPFLACSVPGNTSQYGTHEIQSFTLCNNVITFIIDMHVLSPR